MKVNIFAVITVFVAMMPTVTLAKATMEFKISANCLKKSSKAEIRACEQEKIKRFEDKTAWAHICNGAGTGQLVQQGDEFVVICPDGSIQR